MRLFRNAKRAKARLLEEFKGKKILDVGCGKNKTAGAIGIDRRQQKVSEERQPDIFHDLGNFPWPVPDNSYDLIICQHVIEHLPNTVKTLEEMNRILKPKGKLFIETPHFSWFEAYRHFEHIHKFSLGSFDYFKKGNDHYQTDYEIVKKEIFFDDLVNIFGIGFLANKFPRVYEKRFAFIFPATSFQVTLCADKEK